MDPHDQEDRRLLLLADFPENPNVLEHLQLDDWKKEFPFLDQLKKVRLLGGRGMRLMGISRCLHWELRQSVEGYLGFVLQSIVTGTYPIEILTLRSALLAVGIEVKPRDHGWPGDGARLGLTNIDMHQEKGFKVNRFAITDRWGMYREFDEDGGQLHARPCHNMRNRHGCARALRFSLCGCACPYLHARTSGLGKWLVSIARKEIRKEPPAWDRLVAHKDGQGRVLQHGLPYVDGMCVTPRAWRELDPTHKQPEKGAPLTPAEMKITINAFHPSTVEQVSETRKEVEAAWQQMQEYW